MHYLQQGDQDKTETLRQRTLKIRDAFKSLALDTTDVHFVFTKDKHGAW